MRSPSADQNVETTFQRSYNSVVALKQGREEWLGSNASDAVPPASVSESDPDAPLHFQINFIKQPAAEYNEGEDSRQPDKAGS